MCIRDRGEDIKTKTATTATEGEVSRYEPGGIPYDPRKKVEPTGLTINSAGEVVPAPLEIRGTPGEEQAKNNQKAVDRASKKMLDAVARKKAIKRKLAIRRSGENIKATHKQKPSSTKVGRTVSADNYDAPIGVVNIGGTKAKVRAVGEAAAAQAQAQGESTRKVQRSRKKAEKGEEKRMAS